MWNNNLRRCGIRGAAIIAVCLFVLLSCRNKDPVDEVPPLAPPKGLVFHIPSGQLSIYDLTSLQTVVRDTFDGWAVMAAFVTPTGSHMVLADGSTNRIGILGLPGFQILHETHLGGTPLDVDTDHMLRVVYVITANGSFWSYDPTSDTYDTLGLRLHPRRMAVRPPDRAQAWVACAGSNSLQVINLQGLSLADSITFPSPPTDVQFSSDGDRAYIAVEGDPGSIVVMDPDTRQQINSLPAGTGPFELALSDDDEMLAAVDSSAGRVQFWNLSTSASWERPVGGRPCSVFWAEHTHTCYVLSMTQNHVLRFEFDAAGPLPPDTLRMEGDNVRMMALWGKRL